MFICMSMYHHITDSSHMYFSARELFQQTNIHKLPPQPVKSANTSILVLLLFSINVEMKVSEMWCLESEWSNKKSFLFAKLFMLFPFTFSQLGLYETLWS